MMKCYYCGLLIMILATLLTAESESVTKVSLQFGCPLYSFELPVEIEVNSGKADTVNCTVRFTVPSGYYQQNGYLFIFNSSRTLKSEDHHWCMELSSKNLYHYTCGDPPVDSYEQNVTNSLSVHIETAILPKELRGHSLSFLLFKPNPSNVNEYPLSLSIVGTILVLTAAFIVTVAIVLVVRYIKIPRVRRRQRNFIIEETEQDALQLLKSFEEEEDDVKIRKRRREKFWFDHSADIKTLKNLKEPQGGYPVRGVIKSMLSELGRIVEGCGDGPVELMFIDREWCWEVSHAGRPTALDAWNAARADSFNNLFIFSPPVLLPPSVGGWKLVLRLCIEEGNIQLIAGFPIVQYNTKLRRASVDWDSLRSKKVAFQANMQIATGDPIVADRKETTLGYLWDTMIALISVPVTNFNLHDPPPTVNLNLFEI